VGRDGRWRLPVYVFLIRAHGSTVLVDGGVGPSGSDAAEWLGAPGTLPEQLAALGVAADAVELVVASHLHVDHVGWFAATGQPRFERARYVVDEREWAAQAGRRHVEQSLGPVKDAGRLETVAPGALVRGVELVPLPGHTPGHSGVLVRGPEREALLVGDAFNHPLQITRPEIPSGADADHEQAARSRHEVIERLQTGTALAASAHLPDAWWQWRRPATM
jgi:glyoxylase-like metal-dependent hydrolase (beta-lactamase superfamily II)